MTNPTCLSIRSKLVYEVGGETTFLVNIAAASTVTQRLVHEEISINQDAEISEMLSSGPPGRFHRFRAAAGQLEVNYHAEVELSREAPGGTGSCEETLAELPPSVIPFLYPSRYCESDKLIRMAQRTFGSMTPGHERVCGICNWIFEQVEYLHGSSDSTTSAFDTATQRAGVCRDFAHLAIAFCRALGIPARFCSSYALHLNPPDFHAHFEAWLGGRWLLYDATRLAPEHGFIRIGTGRDAADTSVATVTGPAEFSEMQIEVSLKDPATPPPGFAIGPVSVTGTR